MTSFPDNLPSRSLPRQGLRHLGAVAVALAVNGALVLFMVTWLQGSQSARLAPIRAVPMQVRAIEPEEMEIEEGPADPDQATAPTPVEPPLPEPETLEVAALDVSMPDPAPLAMESLQSVPTATSLAVPAYEGVAPPAPPPAPPRPPGGTAKARAPVRGPVRVSRGPMLVRPPDLSEYYPRRARMRGTTGSTQIHLTVDVAGKVTAVEVQASSPSGVFEQAARRVGQSLSFRPALRLGRPVPARVTLRLVWRLTS